MKPVPVTDRRRAALIAAMGFDVDLRSYEQGWRATFLHRHHVYRPWVGQVIRFYETPGQAIREGAWAALNTSPPPSIEQSPPAGLAFDARLWLAYPVGQKLVSTKTPATWRSRHGEIKEKTIKEGKSGSAPVGRQGGCS